MANGAHTELFRRLRRALRISLHSDLPARELVETRRDFLKKSVALAGAGFVSSCGTTATAPPRDAAPRIAIVGGGVAGLNAAWRLKKKGVASTIYEASSRLGGRMHSATDLMAPGLVTELGGEFVDSNHEDILGLCKEFELELWDVDAEHKNVVKDAFYFGGRMMAEADVIEAFRPIAPRMKEDIEALGDDVDYLNRSDRALAFDTLSIVQYLDRLGVAGDFRSLLEVAFVTEYGLEAGDQSCLNLLMMISAEAEKFELFGDSDERYKVRGGNQSVCRELGKRLESIIQLNQRLESVRPRGEAYSLAFRDPQGQSSEVEADYVILTLPFTMLRQVELAVDLSLAKKKAIAELGYGTSSKLLVGVKNRVWKSQGFRGDCFTDEAFQMAWDNSMCQPGDAGGLTIFQGGNRVAELGKGPPDAQVARLMPGVNKVYPGILGALSGKNARFMWSTHPHTLGGYACYKPGQWTTLRGAEMRPEGRIRFAGEHCSLDFQGFMNGGAETGRVAADSILAEISK